MKKVYSYHFELGKYNNWVFLFEFSKFTTCITRTEFYGSDGKIVGSIPHTHIWKIERT